MVKRLRRRQYDPLIIQRTIGLMLGPSTALYRPFISIVLWLTKRWGLYDGPPCPNLLRFDQGPDLRPLWLFVGTPSAIRPELASRQAEHSLPYSDVTIYIIDIYTQTKVKQHHILSETLFREVAEWNIWVMEIKYFEFYCKFYNFYEHFELKMSL